MLLETDRLRIRDWVLEDAGDVVEIFHRIEVVRWLGEGDPVPCVDTTQAVRWIDSWRGREDPPLGTWAVAATGGPMAGRTIGMALLVPLPRGAGEVEIGWSLHPDAWGHGYASEAGRAVLRRGFEGGLEEIHAVTHLGNEPSQAVCRRIGMVHQGVVERWYAKRSEHYVLTREQWQAQAST